MEISVLIDQSNYFFKISSFFQNNKLMFKSEILGTTISTFNYRQTYIGETIEEALNLSVQELQRALIEFKEM